MTRVTYHLLVDGVKRIECCGTRRLKFESLFPVIVMATEERTVSYEETKTCGVCGMPCLKETFHEPT